MSAEAAAASIIGTSIAADFNKSSAEDQIKFQKRFAKNRFNWGAKDLERAGLNRILAFGNPTPVPSGAKASINAPDNPVLAGLTAASVKQQIQQSKAMTKAAESAANASDAKAGLDREMAKGKEIENTKKEVTVPLYEAAGPLVEQAAAQTESSAKGIQANVRQFQKDRSYNTKKVSNQSMNKAREARTEYGSGFSATGYARGLDQARKVQRTSPGGKSK